MAVIAQPLQDWLAVAPAERELHIQKDADGRFHAILWSIGPEGWRQFHGYGEHLFQAWEDALYAARLRGVF